MRWFIFFHPRPSMTNFPFPSRPGSALRHCEVADYPEVADSVDARACPQKTTDIDGLRYSLMTSTMDLGLSRRLSMFELRETGDWVFQSGRGRRLVELTNRC